jgi:hypothetical protein
MREIRRRYDLSRTTAPSQAIESESEGEDDFETTEATVPSSYDISHRQRSENAINLPTWLNQHCNDSALTVSHVKARQLDY